MIAGDLPPDRRLGLMFGCPHGAIAQAVRAPLILQTLLGLDAVAIGSAFLVSPAAMGQRLVRAKAKIREASIRFVEPEADQRRVRLPAVLDAIYAAYCEGWSDADGSDPKRCNLAEEGIWLGRLVCTLVPNEPEPLGLLALMLHAEARLPARRHSTGAFVALSEQGTGMLNLEVVEEAEHLFFEPPPWPRWRGPRPGRRSGGAWFSARPPRGSGLRQRPQARIAVSVTVIGSEKLHAPVLSAGLLCGLRWRAGGA